MAEENKIRLSKVLRELNISIDRAVDFLTQKGHSVEKRPTTKISREIYNVLLDGFQTDKSKKVASKELGEEKRKEKEALREELVKEQEEAQRIKEEREKVVRAKANLSGPKTIGKIDLNPQKDKSESVKEKVAEAPKAPVQSVQETPKQEAPKVAKKPEAPKKVEAPVKTEKETTVASNRPSFSKPKQVQKIDLKPKKAAAPVVPAPVTPTPATPAAEVKTEEAAEPEKKTIETKYQKLSGPKMTGQKIDLTQFNKAKKKKEDSKKESEADKRKKRKRISKTGAGGNNNNNNRTGGGNRGPGNRTSGGGGRGPANRRGPVRKALVAKVEPTEEEVQKQVRETLEKLQGKSSKSKGSKYRRDKRDVRRQKTEEDLEQQAAESKVLKATEFVTVGELATMMDVGINEIISKCMMLGIMVTMNQRLDADTLTIVAEEFGFTVDFVAADIEEAVQEEEDALEDLRPRAPIVTVMGHVDHGKTSLLDYIRKENVIAGESGGITQHIGAYGVMLENGQRITFLDTPGHEAFTAMRARGAQVTDIAIIVIAADDDVMPQTKEAISHAQAAGVPIIFAINKIDRPTSNPEKIKEKLASMNLLVEDWGGKIQSHDISAKTGLGVGDLLEKVLLEAELLELKANPDKNAVGTVVEAFLDKGRGYVSTILVQNGTLKIGDYLLAGKQSGKIKAMFDERGNKVETANPSTAVSILGLDGAPQAGDKFNVFDDEKDAKQIAVKRTQLLREQSVRTTRRTTLTDIGRRIKIGDFKELNIILKGDVDGSVEALTDSFQKLSTEEIEVKIIHKGVGAITESDVLLASASDAIIIGFNVRPAGNARMVADKEEIDIRTYSIIYDAINDVKDAMEGLLSPEMKEEITGNAEIRETFKISKIGTIAGCMVTDGKIFRNSNIRLIRDGVVIFTGELSSLKRFKDDAKEVSKGYDCGLQVKNYNDIKEGDIVEAFQEVAVKKKLK
ncbi:translation initiation factor IF-2 [Kordia sp. YSTF-M3]|uniref:Translation initiation factor IF-2 n=1 Tax=Kordia aestuariivivens TaxID=2759037 RepID=A0ABR7Q3T3_9FLAO|nr:translation initiation factor IF-2 [Kordia aestuariivivens]MBC8753066.1 translation initiation factor IF-2 [Kordia aestuariivivens]